MQQPAYTLFIRPEVGPITPMELDHRDVFGRGLPYSSPGRRDEIDAVIQRIEQRFNAGSTAAGSASNGHAQPPARLYPERSRDGIRTVLDYLSPSNRSDGIVLFVPGRIAYTIGNDPGLDAEIASWFEQKTAQLTATYRDDLARADREKKLLERDHKLTLEALKQRHASELRVLKERYEALMQKSSAAQQHSTPPPPIPTPDPAAINALHRTIGELEVERDRVVGELAEAKDSVRGLTVQLSRANHKSNKLANENRELSKNVDDLRAALAASARGGTVVPDDPDWKTL